MALRLTPLASDAGTRVLKTALAVGLLWLAVAWALGWFGA